MGVVTVIRPGSRRPGRRRCPGRRRAATGRVLAAASEAASTGAGPGRPALAATGAKPPPPSPPVRLAKPAGTSTTTLSPACRPLVTSTMAPLRPPVVTVRVTVGPSAVPSVATVTVDWPLVVVMAWAGTRRALAFWAVVIDAVAFEPTKNLVGSPVKETWTA